MKANSPVQTLDSQTFVANEDNALVTAALLDLEKVQLHRSFENSSQRCIKSVLSAVLREHDIMANEHVKTLRLAVPGALSKTGELTVKLQTGQSRRGF